MENLHIVPPTGEHTHTIILLHGRDSTATEFALEFFESQASDDQTLPSLFPTIKWVFPTSRLRNSARFNTDMSQWFDIWSVENPSEKEDDQIPGLRESIGEILEVVRNEVRIVPPGRIVIGGISQGCATAIWALLFGGIQLGGFVGLCSWLPFEGRVAGIAKDVGMMATESARGDAIQRIRNIFSPFADEPLSLGALSDPSASSVFGTPVFLAHSEDDDVVPVGNGRGLSETVEMLGFGVTWKSYEDGGHWINEPRGVDDIVAFLKEKVMI